MKKEIITYSKAINQSLFQLMKFDKKVTLIGQLVNYKPGVFGTTTGLSKKFGPNRVFDFPVAESLMTSLSLGLSLTKHKVILVHHRLDFMLYSFDAIVNWLSLWHFKSNKNTGANITIRAIVGKGWGQGPQHSKSLHNWFANLPGIKVAMPATAFDAKGLLIESVLNNNPCIILEHRSLFNQKAVVPKEMYKIKFGNAAIKKRGNDLTIISIGVFLIEATEVTKILFDKYKIKAELIDLRTIYPLDKKKILESVKKTKNLVVLDPGWKSFGAASEIISLVTEKHGKILKSNPLKISYPDSHTPMSSYLENKFYPSTKKILKKILINIFNLKV